MQEQTIQTNITQYIFPPNEEEKSDFITNKYLKKMPRDENLRYELIGGELIVSTAPRFIHQYLATKIVAAFSKHLEANPLGIILTTPGLIFSEFDGVIPDLIYISRERMKEILDEDDGKFYGAPEIIIEILSPGKANARRDLQVKRELFEIYKVPEYWVVNPFEKEISVFKFAENQLKLTKNYKENENLETDKLPDFQLNLKKLFED